eukprot:TRINITY_DN7385_c0_g1_i2.p1 TRINITY_DN7385_c0_g1~~TRINITY_DN7385_c0_g1_i2.p1  ORF type:complete len:342 (-),score=96.78 TRINITY_DN7385_c0_g1_i2:1091-2116(-)
MFNDDFRFLLMNCLPAVENTYSSSIAFNSEVIVLCSLTVTDWLITCKIDLGRPIVQSNPIPPNMSSTLKNRKNKDTTGTTTTKEISPTSSLTKETEETPVDPTLLEPPLTNPTEQDIAELGDCVTFLKNPETDNEVYLIGTAHISEQSMQDVSRIIDKVKPHVIVIELDRSRAVLLNDNSTKEELEKFLEESLWDQVMKAFQKEKSPSSIISAVLVRFSRAMLLKLDVDPRIYGGEFKMAVAGARKYSSVLIFGDRPIQTTIQRTWSAMTWPQTFYAMWEVITNLDMSAFDDLTTEDIEELKNKDTLEFMIGKIKESMPNVVRIFSLFFCNHQISNSVPVS